MGKLTAAKVRSIASPGLHGDGGTLYLCVAPGGTKSWIQRITINGRRRDIGLGGFPLVSLAEARNKAFDNRRQARAGGDPLAGKRKVKVPTFREAALTVFEANKPRWRNAYHIKSWLPILDRHAMPHIGDMPVDRIGREDVLRVLTPIWGTRIETARRVRQRVRAVLRWAQAHGFVTENVAGEGIDGALPAMPAVKEHFRALPYIDVPDALRIVEGSGASLAARLCFRFVVLTAARSGEARGATWDEIDLDARLWIIPPSRMKAHVEHRVPLSDAALAVLEQARVLKNDSDLIFPSPRKPGRPLSDMAMTKLLRDVQLAERATVHGFRSSFRDWCAETNKPRELAEAALAHAVGGVEGAYFRSDLLARRRRLMDQWAAFVTGGHEKKVVPLHG